MPSMHGMHLGSYYDQSDVFLPERYMNDVKSMYALQNGKFDERDQFNFGWGRYTYKRIILQQDECSKLYFIMCRRSCPGVYLAEAEMFLAFVQILARCSIEPPSEGMPDINGLINAGLNCLPPPCKLHFIKRHDSLV